MSESMHLVDETSTVLDTFVQNNEQTLEQFSNLFGQSVDVGTHSASASDENIDGMLSYLQDREDDLVTGGCVSDDTGIFSIVSSTAPEPETRSSPIVDSFSNSGLQCLDVMMNHLRARELSLERSPEYSIELNFGSVQAQNDNVPLANLDFIIDNRLQPASENSENCSSDIPDNDRIAACQNASNSLGCTGNNSSDDIEVIELEPATSNHIEHSRSSQSTIIDFMSKQSVNLKIDNFVSDEYAYDSDKDIDESEQCADATESDMAEFTCGTSYVPSFYKNDDGDNDSMSNSLNLSDDREFGTPTPAFPRSTEQPLPGECIDNDKPVPVDVVHIYRPPAGCCITNADSSSDNVSTCSANIISESNNDSVEQFSLDPDFNYDNAEITPRLSYYQ